MTNRKLPALGGGPPILSAHGRATGMRGAPPRFPLTLSVAPTPEAEATGRKVLEQIRDACNGDDFELLSSLVLLFPEVVARAAEFHALMDELEAAGRDTDIARILREPGQRGPKRGDEFYFVALIEHVMQTENISRAADAIARLHEIISAERGSSTNDDELPLPSPPSEKTLQNQHARLHELFRLWSGSLYIPGELLTETSRRPPARELDPSKFVATKLSNSIIFHMPEDHVSEPGKEH